MKISSLEKFQLTFDKHIELTSAYLEDSSISFIIRCCRLKPRNIILGKYTEKIVLYNEWIDEFGNSLEITKKKKIKINLNDLTIPKDKLTSSDLYENLAIEKIAKISRLAFYLFGKDEDLSQDHSIISFLGLDGFLRSYCLLYGEWTKIPNLYLGFDILKKIANHEDIKYFIDLKIKDMPYPCTNVRSAISFMPPSEAFITQLKRWNQPATNILKIG